MELVVVGELVPKTTAVSRSVVTSLSVITQLLVEVVEESVSRKIAA